MTEQENEISKLTTKVKHLEEQIQKLNKHLEHDFFNLTQTIEFVKMHPDAKPPFKKHEEDAGYDLYADFSKEQIEQYDLKPNEQKKIKTGISISLNDYSVGLIHDRSSMASKEIIVTGGVIDQPYRGEICILMKNLSNDTYTVKQGDRIAQILIQPIVRVEFVEVKELNKTARGTTGFGGSGR